MYDASAHGLLCNHGWKNVLSRVEHRTYSESGFGNHNSEKVHKASARL